MGKKYNIEDIEKSHEENHERRYEIDFESEIFLKKHYYNS